ncbi:MAG: DUF4258 domain-containing protein [Beijerinckiaceae bacterium]|nr:DUF4258 domain-containing protein [Beijerinckiaceae bacterium]
MSKPQPWTPADATDLIRLIASDNGGGLGLIVTRHARTQMNDRNLFMGDLLFLLKEGFVLADGEESTQSGYYKYAMQSRTPNSGNRTVRAIVIPDYISSILKIVTVMWVD